MSDHKDRMRESEKYDAPCGQCSTTPTHHSEVEGMRYIVGETLYDKNAHARKIEIVAIVGEHYLYKQIGDSLAYVRTQADLEANFEVL